MIVLPFFKILYQFFNFFKFIFQVDFYSILSDIKIFLKKKIRRQYRNSVMNELNARVTRAWKVSGRVRKRWMCVSSQVRASTGARVSLPRGGGVDRRRRIRIRIRR